MGSATGWIMKSDGMDLVELLVEVEDAFGVSIPEDECERMRTTKDLIDVVTKLCGASSRAGQPCATARAFFSLRSKLIDLLPHQKQDIRPSSSLESLIPKKDRPRVWRALREGGMELPRLRLSRTASILLLAAALVASICWLTQYADQQNDRLWNPNFWLAGILVFFGVALMMNSDTYWATRIPAPFLTVRDVAIHLACCDVSGRSSAVLARDEVAHNVSMIIAYQLGVSIEELDDDKELVTL